MKCSFSNYWSNRSTPRKKFCQELGLEYLQQGRQMRRLWLLYKGVSSKISAYIYDFISPVRESQRHLNTFNSFSCGTEHFENSFFPCVIREQYKLNPEIGSSSSKYIFRKSLLTFIRPSARPRFIIPMIRSALN